VWGSSERVEKIGGDVHRITISLAAGSGMPRCPWLCNGIRGYEWAIWTDQGPVLKTSRLVVIDTPCPSIRATNTIIFVVLIGLSILRKDMVDQSFSSHEHRPPQMGQDSRCVGIQLAPDLQSIPNNNDG